MSAPAPSHSRMSLRIVALLTAFVLTAPPVDAQAFGRVEDMQSSVAGYFTHVSSGDPTTQVYVWGSVGAPGVYEVSADTDLGKLISLAGGPADAPITEDVEQTTTVRVYRIAGGDREVIYEAVVDQLVREPGRYPTLQDGDVVELETEIEQTDRFTWRDGVSVITGVAAVVLAIERITSLL